MRANISTHSDQEIRAIEKNTGLKHDPAAAVIIDGYVVPVFRRPLLIKIEQEEQARQRQQA